MLMTTPLANAMPAIVFNALKTDLKHLTDVVEFLSIFNIVHFARLQGSVNCILPDARKPLVALHLLAFAIERRRIDAENRRRLVQRASAGQHPPNMFRLDLFQSQVPPKAHLG